MRQKKIKKEKMLCKQNKVKNHGDGLIKRGASTDWQKKDILIKNSMIERISGDRSNVRT
jgi:hypothetical protein